MTARRRRRKSRNLRSRESKEPSVPDELKDDLPLKTKFRCLIWFVLFWVVLIGLVILILNHLDPSSDWQKRIDSGNPPRIEEVVSFDDDLYYDSNDYETGIRHVVWEIESDSADGSTYIWYKVAEFKNDLMTKFARVDTEDEVTRTIHKWNAD